MPEQSLASFENEDSSSPHEQRRAWHVLWTRSNCEKIVTDQLTSKGYEIFLPMLDHWYMDKEKRRVVRVPMFKSYVFVHQAIGKQEYIDISRTKGVVRILGARWDRLAAVPDNEIEAIRKTVDSDLPVTPWQYLEQGDRVRVIGGPLANIEGKLVSSREDRGTLVVSIDLLQRSIAVEIERTQVVSA